MQKKTKDYENIKRIPVTPATALKYSLFMFRDNFNDKGDEGDIRMNIDELLNSINKWENKKYNVKKVKTTKQKEVGQVQKFITIFVNMFFQEFDYNYPDKIDGKAKSNIKNCVKELEKISVDIDQYLTWIYRDWYKFNNIEFPHINLICNKNVIKVFKHANKEMIDEIGLLNRKMKIRQQLLDKAKSLYNEANDKDIRSEIRNLTIQLDEEIDANEFAKKLKIIQEKVKK